MTYNILGVRDNDAGDDQFYPIPGEQKDSVQRAEHDGEVWGPITVGELAVHEVRSGGGPQRLLRIEDIKAAVRITDSRVTVACSKFAKGGGWTGFGAGGIAVALTANAVSKARASRRRQGKMLVGQVAYPWLLSIGF